MDSLRVAFTGLLERYQLPIKELRISETSSWDGITECNNRITVNELGPSGTWPHTNDAIIKFHIQSDDDPYVDHNGFLRANIKEVYCLVNDINKKTVIDTNGSIRDAGNYGVPMEWASFNVNDKDREKSQFKPSEFKPGDSHTWKDGDNLYDIARRMNVTIERLMAFNEIEEHTELEAGVPVYFPVATAVPQRKIRYEVLPEARDMHVDRVDGAKKWAFGNVKTWSDFTSSGYYPHKTNLHIVAVAHVPVEDPDNPTAEAGYYMDALSLGDYETTGQVRYTTGYKWVDLKEGFAVTVSNPLMEDKLADRKAEIESALDLKRATDSTHDNDGFDPEFIQRRIDDSKGLMSFTDTYQSLVPPAMCLAVIPEGIGEVGEDGVRFIWVHDFSGHRPDRPLRNYQEISISGTFEADGVLYGRPQKSALNGYWFGIPMDLLDSQDNVYNGGDNDTRHALGQYTVFEKYIWVPVAKLANRKHKIKRSKP